MAASKPYLAGVATGLALGAAVAPAEPGLADDRRVTLRTASSNLRALATGRTTPAQLIARGELGVDGGLLLLRDVLGLFDPPG
ncbi:MAG: hypothetical protein AAFX50_15380 [Acidobacteriota bacterium]